MKSLIPIFIIACLCSCTPNEKEPITTFHIRSNNPEQLIQWYSQNLGLERSAIPNELKVLGESFEIVFSSTSVPTPEGRTTGFFKIGFSTNQLDEIYSTMQSNRVSFRGEPFFDDNLKQRSLVTLDSDGNRVQLFEDPGSLTLSPYFFSVMAKDFEATKAWYEKELGFEEQFNLDFPQRNLFIRLMKNDRWLLELIGDASLSPAPENAPGLAALGVSGKAEVKDPEGNMLFY